MERKIKIGQAVYYTDTDRRYANELKETVVTTCGSKYFTVKEAWVGRFFVDTLLQDGKGYSPRYKLYLSKEEYNEIKERESLLSSIRAHFQNWNIHISTDDLRSVKQIIDKTN